MSTRLSMPSPGSVPGGVMSRLRRTLLRRWRTSSRSRARMRRIGTRKTGPWPFQGQEVMSQGTVAQQGAHAGRRAFRRTRMSPRASRAFFSSRCLRFTTASPACACAGRRSRPGTSVASRSAWRIGMKRAYDPELELGTTHKSSGALHRDLTGGVTCCSQG